MAPAAISPVIGTGNLQACTTGSAGGIDQRGASRPVQSGALCDIGAVELQVYYVSVNGVDGAGCGSPTAPCRQIWTTIGKVPDYGAIVLVHLGNFTGEGLVISRNLSLYGYAGESITGTGSGSVVTITPSGTASIDGVTIQNGGNANGAGVHVYPGGSLTLDHSTITGNSLSGTSYDAAGLFNDGGTVRISDSTITSNTAGPAGVAGILNTGAMTIVRSAIVNNRAYGAPAGDIDNGGTLTLANSTVAGNIAQTAGGIQNDPTGALHLINDTIADNNAQERFGQSGQTQVGGILNQNSKGLDLTNTIVARNSADVGPDCASAGTVSLGHNLIGNSAACNFTSQSGDQQGVDAQLQGLAHNGGPTLTEAIASTSPAVHGGDNSVCAAGPINNVDQRDLPRPSPTSGVCDIGAFEVQGSGPTAARIGQFHAARRGNVVRFSWRVTAGANLAGFNLMAGGQRLNARLIQVHAGPLYRVHLRVMAGTRFQLQAVLRSGKTFTVASA